MHLRGNVRLHPTACKGVVPFLVTTFVALSALATAAPGKRESERGKELAEAASVSERRERRAEGEGAFDRGAAHLEDWQRHRLVRKDENVEHVCRRKTGKRSVGCGDRSRKRRLYAGILAGTERAQCNVCKQEDVLERHRLIF